ncbi:LysR family transcriptional regulator [Lutimaribacter sp. EGI FJ00015]|uniref:LysR family transcriptional regulator n=1 Tax=Lutimaribacter degradans TaxID=2945989 RepID=A0ACC5ZXN2_9RHOB|nr:LysR family transcriptional regulator [Lutimaribacter sp. EGI FJ00013]MCM2563096.1 LysR family transcriptional regulator [Lutimaribacter sp. EGI FJ00013]MCO0614275.1 LysR family transcriptional regulator [Lutimaribacter sp. EGI FJ00015]MCO0637085.1 LysR family transcriptional regulator [Lutimaribacter sp. EGI FJ00014]
MDNWDEIRTAFQVARLGTVSGAAEVLGVHHATVIRHIDALEGRLGVKLFQRHARGYTPTEAGQDLLRVAQTTDEQFQQLAGRLKGGGNDMRGELVLTSLAGLAPLLAPALTDFQRDNPELVLRYLTGERLFRLEYGEAHVAIRAGATPEEPDNVVQPFFTQMHGLYAARAYADAHGLPEGPEDFAGHAFVAPDDPSMRAPFNRWLRDRVNEDAIRFRSSESRALELALLEGAGIGFLPLWEAARHEDLLEVMPPQKMWAVQMWLVTHVDLHRTAKVQGLLTFLKDRAKDWDSEGPTA